MLMQVIIIIAFVFRLKTRFTGIDFEFLVSEKTFSTRRELNKTDKVMMIVCLQTRTKYYHFKSIEKRTSFMFTYVFRDYRRMIMSFLFVGFFCNSS
jgi:hypothetical protein